MHTIIIVNGIACYLVDPALKFVSFPQSINMGMYLEKNVLQFSRVGAPPDPVNPGRTSPHCV